VAIAAVTSLSAAQAPADQPAARTDKMLGPPGAEDHAPPPTGDPSR